MALRKSNKGSALQQLILYISSFYSSQNYSYFIIIISLSILDGSKFWSLPFNQEGYSVFIPVLLIIELVLGILIIKYVKYTEIDWIGNLN